MLGRENNNLSIVLESSASPRQHLVSADISRQFETSQRLQSSRPSGGPRGKRIDDNASQLAVTTLQLLAFTSDSGQSVQAQLRRANATDLDLVGMKLDSREWRLAMETLAVHRSILRVDMRAVPGLNLGDVTAAVADPDESAMQAGSELPPMRAGTAPPFLMDDSISPKNRPAPLDLTSLEYKQFQPVKSAQARSANKRASFFGLKRKMSRSGSSSGENLAQLVRSDSSNTKRPSTAGTAPPGRSPSPATGKTEPALKEGKTEDLALYNVAMRNVEDLSHPETVKSRSTLLIQALEVNMHVIECDVDDPALREEITPFLERNRSLAARTAEKRQQLVDARTESEIDQLHADERLVQCRIEEKARASLVGERDAFFRKTYEIFRRRSVRMQDRVAALEVTHAIFGDIEELVEMAIFERYRRYWWHFLQLYNELIPEKEGIIRGSWATQEIWGRAALRKRYFSSFESYTAQEKQRHRLEKEARERLWQQTLKSAAAMREREAKTRQILIDADAAYHARSAELEKDIKQRLTEDARRRQTRMAELDAKKQHRVDRMNREQNRLNALFQTDKEKITRGELTGRMKIVQEEPAVFKQIVDLARWMHPVAQHESKFGSALRQKRRALEEPPELTIEVIQEVDSLPVHFPALKKAQPIASLASVNLAVGAEWETHVTNAIESSNKALANMQRVHENLKPRESLFFQDMRVLENKTGLEFDFRHILQPPDLSRAADRLGRHVATTEFEVEELSKRKIVIWGGEVMVEALGPDGQPVSRSMEAAATQTHSCNFSLTERPAIIRELSLGATSLQRLMSGHEMSGDVQRTPATSYNNPLGTGAPMPSSSQQSVRDIWPGVIDTVYSPNSTSFVLRRDGTLRVQDVERVVRAIELSATMTPGAPLPLLQEVRITVSLQLAHLRECNDTIIKDPQPYILTNNASVCCVIGRPIFTVGKAPHTWTRVDPDKQVFEDFALVAPPQVKERSAEELSEETTMSLSRKSTGSPGLKKKRSSRRPTSRSVSPSSMRTGQVVSIASLPADETFGEFGTERSLMISGRGFDDTLTGSESSAGSPLVRRTDSTRRSRSGSQRPRLARFVLQDEALTPVQLEQKRMSTVGGLAPEPITPGDFAATSAAPMMITAPSSLPSIRGHHEDGRSSFGSAPPELRSLDGVQVTVTLLPKHECTCNDILLIKSECPFNIESDGIEDPDAVIKARLARRRETAAAAAAMEAPLDLEVVVESPADESGVSSLEHSRSPKAGSRKNSSASLSRRSSSVTKLNVPSRRSSESASSTSPSKKVHKGPPSPRLTPRLPRTQQRTLIFEGVPLAEVPLSCGDLDTLENLRKRGGYNFVHSCRKMIFKFIGSHASPERVSRFLRAISFYNRSGEPQVGKREILMEIVAPGPQPAWRCEARKLIDVEKHTVPTTLNIPRKTRFFAALSGGEVTEQHVKFVTRSPAALFSDVVLEDDDRKHFVGGHLKISVAYGYSPGDDLCLMLPSGGDASSLTISRLADEPSQQNPVLPDSLADQQSFDGTTPRKGQTISNTVTPRSGRGDSTTPRLTPLSLEGGKQSFRMTRSPGPTVAAPLISEASVFVNPSSHKKSKRPAAELSLDGDNTGSAGDVVSPRSDADGAKQQPSHERQFLLHYQGKTMARVTITKPSLVLSGEDFIRSKSSSLVDGSQPSGGLSRTRSTLGSPARPPTAANKSGNRNKSNKPPELHLGALQGGTPGDRSPSKTDLSGRRNSESMDFPNHDGHIKNGGQEVLIEFEKRKGHASIEAVNAILKVLCFSNSAVTPKPGERAIDVEVALGPALSMAAQEELNDSKGTGGGAGSANSSAPASPYMSPLISPTSPSFGSPRVAPSSRGLDFGVNADKPAEVLEQTVKAIVTLPIARVMPRNCLVKYIDKSGWRALPALNFPSTDASRGQAERTYNNGSLVIEILEGLSKEDYVWVQSEDLSVVGVRSEAMRIEKYEDDEKPQLSNRGRMQSMRNRSTANLLSARSQSKATISPRPGSAATSAASPRSARSGLPSARSPLNESTNSARPASANRTPLLRSETSAFDGDGMTLDIPVVDEVEDSSMADFAMPVVMTSTESAIAPEINEDNSALTVYRSAKLFIKESNQELGSLSYDPAKGHLAIKFVPERIDTTALTRDAISFVTSSLVFMCVKADPNRLTRTIRVALTDREGQTSFIILKLVIHTVDDPSEVILPKAPLPPFRAGMRYDLTRHFLAAVPSRMRAVLPTILATDSEALTHPMTAFPIAPMPDAFIHDSDTEYFDGGTLSAIFVNGAYRGDTVDFMSVEEQRAQYAALGLPPKTLLDVALGNRLVLDSNGAFVGTVSQLPSRDFSGATNLVIEFALAERKHAKKHLVPINLVTYILNCLTYRTVGTDKVRVGSRSIRLTITDGSNPAEGSNETHVDLRSQLAYASEGKLDLIHIVGGAPVACCSKLQLFLGKSETWNSGFIDLRIMDPKDDEGLSFNPLTVATCTFEVRQSEKGNPDSDRHLHDGSGALVGKLFVTKFSVSLVLQQTSKIALKQYEAFMRCITYECKNVEAAKAHETRVLRLLCNDGRLGCNAIHLNIKLHPRK